MGNLSARTASPKKSGRKLAPQPKPFSPLDFVPANAATETIDLPIGTAKITTKSLYQNDGVNIGDYFIELGSVERSVFVKTLADLFIHGTIEIPAAKEICEKASQKNEREAARINKLFHTEAAAFTADENMQEKIVKELWKKLRDN